MSVKNPVFIILLLLTKYGYRQQDISKNVSFFNPGSFGKDTMYIRTRFAECGEWGGHVEEIKVYIVNKNCFASFEQYSADCNSVKNNNGSPIQKLMSKTTQQIGRFEQILIREYIHSLVDLKFSETDFGHAFIISELKFRSEINLDVGSWSDIVQINYNNLKSIFTK